MPYSVVFMEANEDIDLRHLGLNERLNEYNYRRIVRLDIDDERGKSFSAMDESTFIMEMASLASGMIPNPGPAIKKAWYVTLEKGEPGSWLYVRGGIIEMKVEIDKDKADTEITGKILSV